MNNILAEQWGREADFLHKFRGYCGKVTACIHDLPVNDAYNILECKLYPVTRDDNRPTLKDCRDGMHELWRMAYSLEGHIDRIGGSRRKEYKSKLTDEEMAQRIAGKHEHTVRPKPQKFFFRDSDRLIIKNRLSGITSAEVDLFIRGAQEEINCYLVDCWSGVPNREDDIDRLNTLLRQTQRVLDNLPAFIEIVLSERYRNIDFVFYKSYLEVCVPRIWDLLHATKAAIEQISTSPTRRKPLEFKLADSLAYSYWMCTKKKPSADPRNVFMNVLSTIEDAIDRAQHPGKPREVNRMGSALMQTVVAGFAVTTHQK